MKSVERQVHSQNGEDGVLAHIFEHIGVTNQIAVEFGVSAGGGGAETNTRLLAALGWKTFWFDPEPATTLPPGCVFTQKLLTVSNIADTFAQQGIPVEFDLLSIDVDGNDYHLRQALQDYQPRVCVMEYNGSFAATQEYIMPYSECYQWQLWDRAFGASLTSLAQQAADLGYDLVYCESRGVNAFFVRKDINVFEPKTAEQAFVPLWWATA